MLEIMVAMTLFGIALTGLFPLLATYSRQVQRLEKCSPQCGRWKQNSDKTWEFQSADPTYVTSELPNHDDNRHSYPERWNLVPADDPWMWKLGAAASLVPDDTTTTDTAYFRPFPYTLPTAQTVDADDDDDSNDAPYKEDETGWIPGPAAGDLGDSRRHPSGTPSWAATWTFTNVQPGWYRVCVRWPSKDDDPPAAPNDKPCTDVAYKIVVPADPPHVVYSSTVPSGVDQNFTPVGILYKGLPWTPISWTTSSTGYAVSPTDATLIYIPKRDDPANDLATQDANRRAVTIYNGDTVKVQIQVPTLPGFITADGMGLVAMPLNKIVRPDPLARTWSYDSQTSKVTQKVTAKVTVTNP